MGKLVLPVYRPVSNLSVRNTSAQSVSLSSKRGVVEISAIAPDLFRIRMSARQRFLRRPSWAVCKTDWARIPVAIKSSRDAVSLQTERGKLTLKLSDGGWKLQDQLGKEIFRSDSERTGF